MDTTVLEWIFIIVEYFGDGDQTASNVRVMLLDVPYSRHAEDIGSLQYYFIKDEYFQWQLLYDV